MNQRRIRDLLLVTSLVACQSSTSETVEPEQQPAVDQPQMVYVAGPEQSLGLITNRAISSFRSVNGGFQAGHDTHDVTVLDDHISIIPRHVDESGMPVTGGEISLRTTSVSAGPTRLDGDRLTRLVDGEVRVDRVGVVETIKNREDGIEQSWTFAKQPPGELVVSVEVSDQDFIAETDSGLHFESARGLGFRYGHGTWIDAAGNAWAVPAHYAGGQIRLEVPESVLVDSVYPAVLDPTITPEVAVDTAVTGGTGANAQNAAIAFDGTNYLVVWQDRRLSIDSDIFGARVTPAGTVLDAAGIAIGATAGVQSNPAVAFTGGNYIVVWEDFKVSNGTEADIRAARVAASNGAVTQLGVIGATGASETEPAIAASGATALATWTVGAADIAGSVFNGTVFGSAFNVAATANAEVESAVAGSPSGYLVAWSEGATAQDLRGSLVSTAGVVGTAFDISAAAGRQFDPAASFDGTNFTLAWTVNSNGLNIFGSRVSTAGVVLDTHTENAVAVGGVSITSAANSQEQPAIACQTTGCVVLWRDQRNIATTSNDVLAQRLNANFTLAGSEFVVTNALQPQQRPAAASNNAGFFGVWHDLRDAQVTTVIGSTISSAGAVGAPVSLVTGNNREQNPAVGHTGATHIVAWTDSRAGSNDIEFVRFTGVTKLDVTARAASNAAFAQFAPSISSSSSGSAYAVWSDTRTGASADIFATKINADGTITQAAGIPITQAAGDQLVPQVSTNATGTAALVVWQDRRNNNFDIMGALLDANGNLSGTEFVICNASGDQTRPTVAFDATNQQWIVVWSDGRVTTDFDIFGARVSAAGAVLDANGVEISGPTAGSQFSPVIAFTSSVFLVVWEDRRNDGNGDLFGTRLRAGATLENLDNGTLQFGGTTGAQTSPSLAQNVGAFTLVWADTRNAATTGSDIFGIGIGTSGTVGEPEFVISNQVGDETTPAIGDSSNTKVSRVAYAKVNASLQTTRIVTRQITIASAVGNSCSTDAQCGAGGFCRDGKCCESTCGGANNTTDCLACKSALTGQPDGVCAVMLAGKLCRGYADTFCDKEEKCDGTSAVCPDDVGRRQGQTCTKAGGGTGVCPADAVTGAPHVCQ